MPQQHFGPLMAMPGWAGTPTTNAASTTANLYTTVKFYPASTIFKPSKFIFESFKKNRKQNSRINQS
jgi:hypothetical protein